MSNTLVQFRVEESQRRKAAEICEKLGIDLPTALRMFIARLIEEKGIPFRMTLDPGTGENQEGSGTL